MQQRLQTPPQLQTPPATQQSAHQPSQSSRLPTPPPTQHPDQQPSQPTTPQQVRTPVAAQFQSEDIARIDAKLAQLQQSFQQREKSQLATADRFAAELVQLQQDCTIRDQTMLNLGKKVQAVDNRVMDIETKLDALPALTSTIRDSHTALSGEIQAMSTAFQAEFHDMHNNLSVAFQNVETRMNAADAFSKQLASSLDKTQRGLLRQRHMPQRRQDASPSSSDVSIIERASSLPPRSLQTKAIVENNGKSDHRSARHTRAASHSR